ncbi:glutathione S-transferase family protein [Marinobacter sp. AC-23]|uniref:glutathione S-transferase family protein n=1 Tax=Marinobacter sp. AC-23 TaxID=1879031 RepID=UPI0008DE9509|nr:glutathione S-transferase family protein [Marinobacter sp. AC-23]OHY82897.1 glutathione S-transferase [Marinobacter sp. AC-23]
MPDLILYNYALSPFSEKIRAMLGYANLPWCSVTVREMPPRPELSVLTGGYRKVPVAQIGADVFCDSRAIASEIARLAGKPELILEEQPEEVQAFVREADLEIFLACVISASDGQMLRKLIRETSLMNTLRFLKDRINMGRKSRVKALRGKAAKEKVMAHIASLDQRLEDDFLFGPTPCVADFSAYHGLWFVSDLAGKPWLQDYPKVSAWLLRMKAFGHGQPEELSANDAAVRAKISQPRALPPTEGNAQLSQQVTIAPDDYGRDPVSGTLVYTDKNVTILARETHEVGLVHVHFPKQGFRVRPVESH